MDCVNSGNSFSEITCETNVPVIQKFEVCFTGDEQYLDCGKKELKVFPEDIYQCYAYLKFVYLEGNLLENLPDNLFLSLPVLKWLDVRNNKLTQFPKTVAYHDNLQVLLLQGNQIQRLPLELGLVPKLRGLQLLGNPLKFPPDTVVQSGVLAILEFLRQECSPSTVRPVEKLTYVKSTNGSDKIKKGKPKTHSSAISKRRLPSKVARPKAMSADLPSIMVKGYRHERELVAPKPTPAPHGARSAVQYSTCAGGVGVMAGELRPDRGITNLHNFHSVEEKISHLWPRTSPRPSTSHRDKSDLKIQENHLKEICIARIKEMLERQATILQRRKDKETLKSWRRDMARFKCKKTIKNPVLPYDTNPCYMTMLSRAEMIDSAATRENITRINNTTKTADEQMAELFVSLRNLEESRKSYLLSPRSEQTVIQGEIRKINELQKKLQSLKFLNEKSV